VLGDFNLASTTGSFANMRESMRAVSEAATKKGMSWKTNFSATRHYDDIWVAFDATASWGSNAGICEPLDWITSQASVAYGVGLRGEQSGGTGVQLRSAEASGAIYPDHRLVWADFSLPTAETSH